MEPVEDSATATRNLINAIKARDLEAVRRLLANGGVDVNRSKSKKGRTPLRHAIDTNQVQVVQLLLERGADPSTPESRFEQSAPGKASFTGRLELVRVIFEHAKRNLLNKKHEFEALTWASCGQDSECIDVVEYLLDQGAPAVLFDGSHWRSAVYAATDSGRNTAVVKLFARRRVDFGVLVFARDTVIEFINDYRTRISLEPALGAFCSDKDVTKRLLAAELGMIRTLHARQDSVDRLLSPTGLAELLCNTKKANLQREAAGGVPATSESQELDRKCITLLSQHQPKLCLEVVVDDLGSDLALAETDLLFHCVALSNFVHGECLSHTMMGESKKLEGYGSQLAAELVNHHLLVDYVAVERKLRDIELRPKAMTALTMATMLDSKALVNTVIDAGAMLNLPDATGQTALHYAASVGNVSMVTLLSQRGARHGLPDLHGKDALEVALESGHQAVSQLLKGFELH